MNKIKLQIKSAVGSLLFEYEKENNTIKETVLEAIKSGADLSYANLSGADLSGADLSGADLSYADLRSADLRSADLRSADLSGANLRSADLSYANLSGADLSGADLSYANLRSANLRSADLRSARANESTSMFFNQCPVGSFIGWKKSSGKIVKLLILEDSKRSSATSLKCRCSKAKVLEIEEYDGSISEIKIVRSNHDSSFQYKVGEIVEVEDFDEDRWSECSTGIHFFIDRNMAINY